MGKIERAGQVSLIRIYPVKSTAGMDLSSTYVETYGLRHDRRFMLVDEEGRFLDARRCPKLLSLSCMPSSGEIRVAAGGLVETFTVDRPVTPMTEDFVLWNTTVSAVEVSPAASAWFSAFLSVRCRLVCVPAAPVAREAPDGDPVIEAPSFVDSQPILIISQSAVEELNARVGEEMSRERFRPNLVVDGCPAHAEDSWRSIRIGNVDFDIVGPCERCILTTYDPQTLEKHSQNQPMRALGRYRRDPKGRVTFGAYALPRNLGRISVGDPVSSLK